MAESKLNLKDTSLGIELGSTRIKAILTDSNFIPIATGEYSWENEYKNELWTYKLEDAWFGIQSAYLDLKKSVKQTYSMELTTIGSIGFSGMMHGYLPFDDEGNQISPFRTWRNNNTQKSAKELTSTFQFNIPMRWSVAHLYQAILDHEKHIHNIDYITTLAGYIHWKLTDEKKLGIGEASGMFPIDSITQKYNNKMLVSFNQILKKHHIKWSIEEILPEVSVAGENAGILTDKGAKLLDPTGVLKSGIPLCPPEGDACTGMVATNSVKIKSGNISAGTSIFSMIVLEKKLSSLYEEIDIVATPDGNPVAMIHCNNFTSDINDWIKLFKEFSELIGSNININEIYQLLFENATKSDSDLGNLINIGYYSGEPITNIKKGVPLFMRLPNSKLNLANFMNTHIYSALATLELGMNILTDKEKVTVENIQAHGGFFKTRDVSQQIMADVLNTPVITTDSAGKDGAWGMAILASFMKEKTELPLEDFLEYSVFKNETLYKLNPTKEGIKKFQDFSIKFDKALKIEKFAGEVLFENL